MGVAFFWSIFKNFLGLPPGNFRTGPEIVLMKSLFVMESKIYGRYLLIILP